MKPFISMLLTLLVAVASEPPAAKNHLPYSHWPGKSAKQTVAHPKTKTLMVQIRSDHPVPLVFKGRPGATHHTNGHFLQLPHAHTHTHMGGLQRRPWPVKLSAPIYLKTAPTMKQILRQPLKIKLSNLKTHAKPIVTNYEKPYRYEKPISMSYLDLENVLPTTTKASFISEHFAPIHTIPAPNLALHDNHIHHEEANHEIEPAPAPKPQPYHQLSSSVYKANTNNINNHNINNNHIDNQYQVLEEITNDATFVDPFSDSQKLFAPDPDPSLPTSKLRPATEPYNQPSNGKPLPSDILQSNHLVPVQPLVQSFGAQQAKLTASIQQQQQQKQLQPFISEHLTAIQAAPIANYNPTYLVTQSNNLYSQHKQQLFQPHVSNHAPNLVDAGYVNADLTQEVASDGQILQAGKHANRNIAQSHESLPQFAALIAAPSLGAEHTAAAQVAPFSLPNVASAEPQGGFVISNYYSNGVQDNSQLLQAYAEEEAHRQHQQSQAEHAALELQSQQQQQEQEQQQYQQQQQQLHLQQIQEATQAQQHLQSQHFLQEQSPQNSNAAAAAFEEHQRLVQQHLGSNTPLRIFVPDDDESRVQKRSGKEPTQTNA